MATESSSSDRRTVELWIRSLPGGSGEQHESLITRLRRIEAMGVLDDVTVHTWERCIDMTDPHVDDPDRRAWERVIEFLQWAVNNDVTLVDFRETAAVGEGRMGPEHPVVCLPRTVLAEYKDGDLLWVLPFQRKNRRYTVSDWFVSAGDRFDPDTDGHPFETVTT